MSVTIEKLRTDIKDFTLLKDQFLTQYHQTCGAISVLEQQLKLLVSEDEHNDPQLNKIINDIIEKQNEEGNVIEPV